MEISNLNTAAAYEATHASLSNSVAAHALPATFVAPGKTFSECTNLIFSESFTKYLNVTRNTPPLTIADNVNEYFSACICKVYNDTFPSLKDGSSNVFKNTALGSKETPKNYEINSLDKIPPIFRNISFYFFKEFIPEVERTREPGNIGAGTNFGITFLQEFANTLISMELSHDYAQGSTPAQNSMGVSVRCSGKHIGWAKADKRMVDLIKNLCIQHFKKMGVDVWVNYEEL